MPQVPSDSNSLPADSYPDNRLFPHGPEFGDSGDPQWIEPRLDGGFALPGDLYLAFSRWKDRIYPSVEHPAEHNPVTLARTGFRAAFDRFYEMQRTLPESLEGEADLVPRESPTLRALVAVQDVLEWTHSLFELHRSEFPIPSDADAVFGPFVTGALGARNAAHHSLRRIVGLAKVPPAIYVVDGPRWVHSGTYAEDQQFVSVRWVEDVTPDIRLPYQRSAYLSHLAGRDVRNTLNGIFGFFFYTVEGNSPPRDLIMNAAHHPPPIAVH